MKIYLWLFLLGSIYLVSGVFFSNVDLKIRTAPEVSKGQKHDFYDYSGVINVHSNKSRGSGRVQDIIAAANDADLDFIFFNETNPIDLKQPPPIKFGNLHVFYGFELSFGGSRFLYTSLDEAPVFSSNSDIQLFVSNHLNTGGDGFLVLAHPNKPGYEWTLNKRPNFISGVEVLNLREVWREAWKSYKFSFLTAVFFYPFNPSLFFLDIYSDEGLAFKTWDEWSNMSPVQGFVGSDVTSKLRITKKLSLNFPSYKNIFLMAQNHVLLREELLGFGNHEKIFKALQKGQSYFSIDLLGDPEGFAFWAETKTGKKILMGQTTAISDIDTLNCSVPTTKSSVEVLLYQNGHVVHRFSEDCSYPITEKGSYRLEVRVKPLFPLIRPQKWIPWIFSNPIFVKPS